ncbi:signal peptide peptidase SppA [bacterium]|nr:signal peptide peptidase SppA [bacterium]
MKKSSYVLIIILIFIILIGVTIFSFLYYGLGKPPSVKANSYLEINLSGPIQERAVPGLFMNRFLGEPSLSMYDIWMNIQKAKVDSRIQNLVIHIDYLQCNWGKVHELREMILDFRKTGKKAYAYIDEALEFDKEYYLATACDQIILHPLGSMVINGIGGYIPFFKKTLNILGIEAEFEHVEEYKTAYNQFTEKGFTPAHEEMMKSIYQNLFSIYLNKIAEERGMNKKEIKALIDQGFHHGKEAKESGLVDKLYFEDQLINHLRTNDKPIHKITHSRYAKVKPSSLGLHRGKNIALIYGMGPIHTGEGFYQTMGSSTISRWFRKVREDETIKAVVFRVDSPGGSAVASDIIWRELVLTKKKKPVVISMSDVAGSGGYWISMAAHKIIAHPQTLTGSIGVLTGKFNLEEFYKKLGVTAEKLTYGKRADLFSTFRGLTPQERKLLKDEISWIYDKFITKVARGRNMKKKEVDEIGKGRIWTGIQAQKRGLVDEMGGLSKAISAAKKLAGIPEEKKVMLEVWPKKVSFLDILLGRKPASVLSLSSSRKKRFLSTLKCLEKKKTWALMPYWISPE